MGKLAMAFIGTSASPVAGQPASEPETLGDLAVRRDGPTGSLRFRFAHAAMVAHLLGGRGLRCLAIGLVARGAERRHGPGI